MLLHGGLRQDIKGNLALGNFLARLDEVQEELLYYPRRWHQRWWRRWR